MRAEYKRLRASLRSAEKDRLIAERLLFSPYAEYGSFFVYLSFGSEAVTSEIVSALKRAGKTVCVPRICGKEMQSVPLTDALTRNAFGILQPESGNELTCDVAITPLLAVDREGYRLGYGGGYYDRYFARCPRVIRVGLLYEGQAVERLPHGKSDLPLDAAVSESKIRVFTQRK